MSGGDGFTAASAVHNDTFTFRTKVFGESPPVELHKESRLRPNKWNEFSMTIAETGATFWVNGVRRATCCFKPGFLPSATPYIGLYAFTTSYKFRKFDASHDLELLAPFLPIHLQLSRHRISEKVWEVSCMLLSGEVISKHSYQHGEEFWDSAEKWYLLPILLERWPSLLATDIRRNATFTMCGESPSTLSEEIKLALLQPKRWRWPWQWRWRW